MAKKTNQFVVVDNQGYFIDFDCEGCLETDGVVWFKEAGAVEAAQCALQGDDAVECDRDFVTVYELVPRYVVKPAKAVVEKV